jgi:hypothetical protein
MPIAKLNLDALNAKPKTGTRKTYPVLPADDETKQLVQNYLDNTAKIDALEGANKVVRSFLEAKVRPYYYEAYHGKMEVDTSIEAPSVNGESILFTFQNRYRAVPDEAPIVGAIGEERTSRFFYQSYDLKLDGDKIPVDVAPALLADLAALMEKHGASAALSAKSVIKPSPEFHTARHTVFSVEENLALDSVAPMVVACKTKGRK